MKGRKPCDAAAQEALEEARDKALCELTGGNDDARPEHAR
jgi:hypothetical protein